MQPELALERLNEARRYVDGDVAELMDSVAMLIQLQQDVGNPMFGAKVTLHLKPEGEYRECSREAYETAQENGWPAYAHANGEDMLEADEEDLVYNEFIVSEDEDREVTEFGTITRRAIVYQADVSGNAPEGTLWDPNKEEYTTAEEYPLGTVNVVVPAQEDRTFGEDYVVDTEEFTSITPAEDTPSWHCYTPGWN